MKLSSKELYQMAKDYFMIIVGLFIYAFGLTAFLLPEKVVMGGMAGVGSLIYYLCGFPVGYSVFIINAALLAMAYKGVGRKFVIRTIFATFAMSFLINILQPHFTQPFIEGQPFVNIILGSVLCGLGVGIVFISNGSTRSEERRVGKESLRLCRYRVPPRALINKNNNSLDHCESYFCATV